MSNTDWITAETDKLRRAWDRHAPEMLRDYLVSDVENPCLNLQSILTRHFLIETLFGQRFAALQTEELRFAVALNWLLHLLEQPLVDEDLQAVYHALRRGADNAEGWPIPGYVSKIFAALPATASGLTVPNYLDAAFQAPLLTFQPPVIPETIAGQFLGLWKKALARKRPKKVSVLEAACGSANDYRFMAACGLGRLIEYHGFDLCEQNIANARSLFPAADFQVENALKFAAPEGAFDITVVHDLFEHLSIKAMEAVLAEVCRVTRRGLCLGFFNAHEGEEHLIVPTEDYHWNTLSVDKLRGELAQHGFQSQVIHIGTFQARQFGCPDTHNPNAYTFYAWRTVTAD
jgi:ubiquinone/menaquinone biosynthesis C-methylase UbiE